MTVPRANTEAEDLHGKFLNDLVDQLMRKGYDCGIRFYSVDGLPTSVVSERKISSKRRYGWIGDLWFAIGRISGFSFSTEEDSILYRSAGPQVGYTTNSDVEGVIEMLEQGYMEELIKIGKKYDLRPKYSTLQIDKSIHYGERVELVPAFEAKRDVIRGRQMFSESLRRILGWRR